MIWTEIGEHPNYNKPVENGNYWVTAVVDEESPAVYLTQFHVVNGYSILDSERSVRLLAFMPVRIPQPEPYIKQ